MFLLYINDIVDTVRFTKIRLFADDTCLFIEVDNDKDIVADNINRDLISIQDWANKWLISFSPPKTKSLLISNKQDKRHPHIVLNGTSIEEISHHKHLGVTLSHNLWWHEHLMSVSNKAMKRLDVISALKFKLDRRSLERYYFSFYRPIIEYGDVVWDGAHNLDLELLDKVQNRAMRIVSGATRGSSVTKLYEELPWEKLHQRRTIHKLKYMYKIIEGLAPEYLVSILPPITSARTTYQLRNNQNVTPMPARLESLYRSFFPSAIRSWNIQPVEVRNSSFSFGDRMNNIHHARLRIGCSKLNAHLHYNLHVIDSPYCLSCAEEVEDP